MQDRYDWAPPGGVLGRILAETAERVAAIRGRRGELEEAAASAPAPLPFQAALKQPGDVAVIAEIKRRSPSKGEINPGIDAVSQGRIYEAGGAAAISVLTEPLHFGGSLEDLRAVAAAVKIPVIRKDFCIDRLQLLEARANGAAAALLIARALHPEKLLELAGIAKEIGIEVLVEVRSSAELETALRIPGVPVGVNNRNLETLETDMNTGATLIRCIPADRAAVFESGVSARRDVEFAASIGADAVLVGSSLSSAGSPLELVRSLTGVGRTGRDSRG